MKNIRREIVDFSKNINSEYKTGVTLLIDYVPFHPTFEIVNMSYKKEFLYSGNVDKCDEITTRLECIKEALEYAKQRIQDYNNG